jgi:DNA-directed RNA polymerase subunit K/omega
MKKMTIGEKIIWAAAYVDQLSKHEPSVLYKDEAEGGNSLRQACVEFAAGEVMRLRELTDEIREGYGEESDAYLMMIETIE